MSLVVVTTCGRDSAPFGLAVFLTALVIVGFAR
jgi:hypothetical protein